MNFPPVPRSCQTSPRRVTRSRSTANLKDAARRMSTSAERARTSAADSGVADTWSFHPCARRTARSGGRAKHHESVGCKVHRCPPERLSTARATSSSRSESADSSCGRAGGGCGSGCVVMGVGALLDPLRILRRSRSVCAAHQSMPAPARLPVGRNGVDRKYLHSKCKEIPKSGVMSICRGIDLLSGRGDPRGSRREARR